MGGGGSGIIIPSLQPPASFPELYVPLWWYSGSYSDWNNANNSYNSTQYLSKGTTSGLNGGGYNAGVSSSVELFTINAHADPNTEYALEVTAWGASGYQVNVQLWDLGATSATAVGSAPQIQFTSVTTATVMRSGKFTLIPGHTYGISMWSNNGAYITDASLVVFPNSATQSPYPSLSSISLANPNGNTLKESKIPLWVYSSGTAILSGGAQSLGTYWIRKGTTSPSFPIDSTMKLITLSSSWSVSQKFAFEASFYNGTSGDTAQVELWDTTLNTAVASSLVSTTSNTATLIRSGSFTLTPGHSYGVTIGQTAGSCSLTKAQLVALSS